MPYSFTLDIPIDADVYTEVRTEIGAETPPGLVSHVVMTRDGGLRYVDVWESKDAWDRFRVARLEPALGKVRANLGISAPAQCPVATENEIVDVWQG